MLSMILTIIVINLAYVSLFTLRVLFTFKGLRVIASFVSMAEVFIYLMGLTLVLDNLDKPINIAAYCFGWGLGVYVGSRIEKKLALGYTVFEVVVNDTDMDICRQLREKNYGVTSWFADGKDGKRLVMKVLAKRKDEQKLRNMILGIAPKAFIISYEPTTFNGGFLVKNLR
ncbi:DUF2179 domain-containing protein [Sporosarcina saromensis]|uniref:UPF0316 protein QT711_02695 n=1 Tax=Sporosarcina saromensis TaxID=359365 RepID=A0ABU4G551_9BACL|nr:DUF2179 domain-containing protein [Sporosarcina saromensis]MDW0112077.1 DUF2179 domain-containing protein [Sporosarcina saromensis]